jgi:2-hydroxychromene-2-carboxylate isomerase
MGWNPREFLAYTASDIALARLRITNDLALQHGVFGVPTMRIGSEIWWGNDRLEFLEDFLRESAR